MRHLIKPEYDNLGDAQKHDYVDMDLQCIDYQTRKPISRQKTCVTASALTFNY